VCKQHGYYRSEGCVFCDEAWQREINAADIGTQGKIAIPLSDLTPPQVPARKDDAGKPDMTLITYSMLEPAAKILKFGEKKYGRLNYRNPSPGFEQRLVAATLRHLLQHTDGQELDSESNEPHLAHALTALMLIFDRRAHKKEGEEL
jgi:hypothetical protein